MEQTKYKKSIPDIIYDSDRNPITKLEEKVNCFAKYFESVPKTTDKKIIRNHGHYLDYFKKKRPNRNYLPLHDCTHEEVKKHISQLKNICSTGPIKIPNYFLKLVAEPLSHPLACAINKSMRAGYFPSNLKLGKQTPVFKSGEHTVNNFRPITVCSSFSKILEKVVRDRLTNFIAQNNIINHSQFGFRRGHSTTHATINLLESTLDGLDSKLKVGGVYLDISKAFDCVNHDILLKKLEFYGIRANALMWFESYLKDRTQYVEIKGTKSDKYTTNVSVPQGGTLSATLFILFTNDIVESTDKLKFSIYADDTSLIVSVERDLYDSTLKTELKKVMNWFSSNGLLLNITKTEYTFFGPFHARSYIKGEYNLSDLHQIAPQYLFDNYNPNYPGPSHEIVNKRGEFIFEELHEIIPNYLIEEYLISDNGTIITPSTNVKYLGLYIDSNLKFEKHIAITSCKMSRLIGIYWKCLDLDLATKKLIYHSLVESHLNYGILLWCSALSKNLKDGNDNKYSMDHIPQTLKPIKTIQNKILRAIFGKRKFDKNTKTNTPSSPLYKELKVLKFQDLYYYNLALLVHDYFYNNIFPDALREKFECMLIDRTQNQNTRSHNLNITYNVPNLEKTLKKPTIAGSILWNKLPNDIKQIKGKVAFKKKLKVYFLDSY